MLSRFLFALWATSAAGILPAAQDVDPNVMQIYAAQATIATGNVSLTTGREAWSITSGEYVPVRQVIATGSDGYAHFEVPGGSSFDLYSDSQIIFRQNPPSPGDLLDVLGGRVRIHLQAGLAHLRQRVFTPTAMITAEEPTTIAIAVDESGTTRIDVVEGQVYVQHTLLPKGDGTVVRAVDAILVRPNEPISRHLDRGAIYRLAIKPLRNVFTAITFGHFVPASYNVWG